MNHHYLPFLTYVSTLMAHAQMWDNREGVATVAYMMDLVVDPRLPHTLNTVKQEVREVILDWKLYVHTSAATSSPVGKGAMGYTSDEPNGRSAMMMCEEVSQ